MKMRELIQWLEFKDYRGLEFIAKIKKQEALKKPAFPRYLF
ncbi:MAG TPA: hypothetical protein VMZ91_00215 [Candidatus Paceibacterota bacterium]|nr:hypothetical protein [Candidatus Paceibacterota bacterium]